MLSGSPIHPEDLDDGFDLVVATLPRSQEVAEALTDQGLERLGLPETYPRHRNGRPVGHQVCQPIGAEVEAMGLRGIRARSAATTDGSGRELAWFPARPSSRASMQHRLHFRDWWFDSGTL